MKSKHTSSKKAFTLYTNLFSNLGKPVDMSMDWSEDAPIQVSPPLYAPLVGNYMPLPHVPLPHGTRGNNMTDSNNQNTSGLRTSVLNYNNNQPTDPGL